jgi:hypothetical protein
MIRTHFFSSSFLLLFFCCCRPWVQHWRHYRAALQSQECIEIDCTGHSSRPKSFVERCIFFSSCIPFSIFILGRWRNNNVHTTQLVLATRDGNPHVLERLLQEGGDPNSDIDFGGGYCILLAAYSARSECARLLVKYGVHTLLTSQEATRTKIPLSLT